ncbi:MAG: ABC transporter permease [Tyzzerella sp.]|nr:ABC transporter permease [Tyzzerella sp.]
MIGLGSLIKRNTKLFFKDKGLFFTSLITPLILLVLYATFLGNVYHDSFAMSFPEGMEVPEKLLDAAVGGQLVSSLLAVCCVTVAFCSNMLMVQDKVNGTRKDLTITPVKGTTMALGYYIATLISTLLICLLAAGAGFLYLGKVGWYLSGKDVMLILFDVFLLVMFGVALSSIINFFMSTQGQISAVGSIVSSMYGFICGAYMPISQFSEGLQKALSFLPGTYATSLLRNHAMQGVFAEMKADGYPKEIINGLRDVIDCNVYFFDQKVELSTMYLILSGSVVVLIGIYVVMNMMKRK